MERVLGNARWLRLTPSWTHGTFTPVATVMWLRQSSTASRPGLQRAGTLRAFSFGLWFSHHTAAVWGAVLQLIHSGGAWVVAIDTHRQEFGRWNAKGRLAECEHSYASPAPWRWGHISDVTHGNYAIGHDPATARNLACGRPESQDRYNRTLRFVASPWRTGI